MNIAIYSRKSKFTGKGESIENQIELCRQYVRSHYDVECSIVTYEDEGYSGGTTERPQFKQLIEDARQHKLGAVICYRLDRISRNIADFADLIEELNSLNIDFVSIREQFDTSSPMGRAMMYICSIFSQLERETIAERIRDNLHELAKTGRWLGGMTPTGFQSEKIESVTLDGKIKKACKLKIVPEEAELIRLIYTKFIETKSLSKTETYLVQNNIKTKRGLPFTRFALKNILTNPVYMIADKAAFAYLTDSNVEIFSDKSEFDGKHGIMAYNRTIQKAGTATKIRPLEDWIVSVGKHFGLINGKDWVRIQESLEQNRSKSFRKPRSNVALLSGLLCCANCGDFMRPKLSTRYNAKGERIYTYLCMKKEVSRKQVCSIKNVNGNLLDSAICEEIKMLGEDNSEFLRQLEYGKRNFAGEHADIDADLERLKKSVIDIEKEIARLVASLTTISGSSAESYIVKEIEKRHDKVAVYKQRIEELERLTENHALSEIQFDIIRQMLISFKNTIDDMSVEQKRIVIRTFIKKITWDGVNVQVYLFGADPAGSDKIELPPLPSCVLADSNGSILETGGSTSSAENEMPLCENSIFYTPCRISRERSTLVHVVCGDSLNKTNGANGNHIVAIPAGAGEFLRDMRHKPEIVFNQACACFIVAHSAALQAFSFFFSIQWFRERIAAIDIGGKKEYILEKLEYNIQHSPIPPSLIRCIREYADTACNLFVPQLCVLNKKAAL